MPKPENCTFYKTAAEAENAGFRPCLLCRPESAPSVSVTKSSATPANRAAKILEKECGSKLNQEEIAARLGCTSRHLNRVFKAEYRVSPGQYLQTCRLLLAKSLLAETNLPISDVARAAGFGSLRHFNASFKKHYRLTPTEIRNQKQKNEKQTDSITLSLGYRPPYPWHQVLDFLETRAIPGVEKIQNGEYMRAVHIETEGEHRYGWVKVGHNSDKNALSITISASLLPVLSDVLFRIRRLFDLNCDPELIYEILSTMNEIKPGLCILGTRLPGCFNSYEMAVRAVLGQQITVKAARTLALRMTAAYGTPVQTGIEGLTHTFPAPEKIASLSESITDSLGPLGIIATRAKTISALSQAFMDDSICFDACVCPEAEMEKLKKIPGIGPWTAKYIAMRAMEWPDAFLETDAGIKKALAPLTEKETAEMAKKWRPWRSYATINIWNSLKENE